MWKKLALLLIIGLAATASAQDAATASPTTESIPFLEIPVKIADTRVDLGLFEGDNVNEAVEKFGADNSLDADSLATLKAEVTRRLVSIAEAVTKNIQQSKQTKEPLFEFPVALDDGEVVPLRLFEGDNLQEAVAAFAKRQSIPKDLVPVLFEQVRAKVFPGDAAQDAAQDAGAAPTAASSEDPAEDPVFSIPITVFGKEEQLKLFKGDVLGERVRAFATMHGLDDETEAKVLEAVAERVRSTQESVAAAEANRAAKDRAGAPTPPTSEPKAPLYEISFKNAEGNVYPLRLYEGDVLEKAVTDFVTEHGFDTTDIPILVEQVSARMRSDAEQKAATSGEQKEGNVAAGTDRLVTLAVSMEDPDPSKPPLPPIALHRGKPPSRWPTSTATGTDSTRRQSCPRLPSCWATCWRKPSRPRQRARPRS